MPRCGDPEGSDIGACVELELLTWAEARLHEMGGLGAVGGHF